MTFEQGRQDLDISDATMLQNIVTENKFISEEQRRDLIISLIVLKYTQSNSRLLRARTARPSASVPASRAASTAPAWQASKADNWQLRQHAQGAGPALQSRHLPTPTATTPSTSTSATTYEDVLGDGVWAAALHRAARPADAGGEARVAGRRDRCCAGQRRLLPLRR